MRKALHRFLFGGYRRRRAALAVLEAVRKVPVPQVTVRAAWILRLMGFTIGDSIEQTYLARADCRIDVMRLPAGARAIGTGQPVRQARMSLISWARVLRWRLLGKL
jgi:hypothetical protein